MLRRALSPHGAQIALFRSTGIPQSTLSRLADGQKPGRRHAVKLLGELGIGLTAWDEPPEPDVPTAA